MSKFACSCPKCNSSLRFEVGDKTQLKITCPKCQHAFQIKINSGTAAAPASRPAEAGARRPAQRPPTQPAIHPKQSDPCFDWNELPQLDNRNSSYANQNVYSSHGKREKKSTFNPKKLFAVIATVAASLGGLGLVVGGIMWGKQFLPDGIPAMDVASTFSGSLFAAESRSGVAADLQALRTQVEKIGLSIPSGDQSEASAQLLLSELPKFQALFRRACKVPVESVSLEEFATRRNQLNDMLAFLRNQAPVADSSPTIFWSVDTGAGPEKLVRQAINEVTMSSNSVSSVLSDALIELPDPLTYAGTDFEWSDEDRRVLAIIRLRGSLERDALRLLANIDPKAAAQSEVNKLHALIDQTLEAGIELGKLRGKSVGGILAFVPKGNPYEPQQNSSAIALNTLRKSLEAEATLPVEVDFLFADVDAVSEFSEGLIFGSNRASSVKSLTTAPTSAERLQAFIVALDKQKQDALQAEIDRQEKEKQELAAAQLRKQQAEEEDRKREEERKRALEERMAAASSGKAGGGLGGGPRGMNGNVGPRPGRTGVPSGPGGLPTNALGAGDTATAGQRPGQPPNFPGYAGAPNNRPRDRFQPQPASQGDPAKMVTITCAKVKNADSSAYLRDLPKWLLQYSPVISVSNGDLKITVQNYDKPLADLEPCFPSLVFETIDTESRTIIAKEK